jgi:hypothetical protein
MAQRQSGRMDSPYGKPPSQIIYDTVAKEGRVFGTKERFGAPYRSEKSEDRTRDDRRDERRGDERREDRREERSRRNERERSASPKRYSRDDRRINERREGERREGERREGDRREVAERRRERSPTPERYRPSERTSERHIERRRDRSPERTYTRDKSFRRDRSPSPRRTYGSVAPTTRPQKYDVDEEDFENMNKQVIIPEGDLNKIRSEMIKLMDKPFTIVEGVVNPSHESSSFFAEGKNVNKLFTYIGKNDPKLIESLEKYPNINIIEDNFVYTPPEVTSPFILFFYPYWLMNMDERSAKKVYFKNIPLTSGTFDDILRIEQPDYFVFIIPKNVAVPKDYGNITEVELSKGKMVIIKSSKQSKVAMYSKTTGKKEYKTEEEWDKNFLKFLKNLLIPINIKEETIDKIVNYKTLPIWKKAFTHESVDLNDNYEQLETIGDRVLELAFLKYLIRRFPDLSPQEITELKSKYMSKIYQGTVSRKLGFGDWIRSGDDISSINILEDVFESFFGALFEIADSVIGDGVGYVMSLKVLSMIFSDFDFDLSKAQGHPKSQIKEIFEMLKLDPEVAEIVQTDKGVNVSIQLTDRTYNDLMKLEVINKDASKVIGYGFGPFKTYAVNLAYSNALNYLESLGITREWAERQKELLDLTMPELEPYLDAAIDRMGEDGYERMYLRTSRTSTKAGNVFIQLVGVYFDKDKNKDQKKILVSGKYPSIQEGKIDVVKKYSEGK